MAQAAGEKKRKYQAHELQLIAFLCSLLRGLSGFIDLAQKFTSGNYRAQ